MKKLTTSQNSIIQKALPFVIYENNKFIIPEEAKTLLSNDSYCNVGIMSLVGKYRTGKSFLLNRVLLNHKADKGFGVGPTFKPCTKGIWIWSDPLYITNKHCNETFPCFVIDTEGLCAYDEEINHDSKIFLIATLISSLFIFNSFGAIDETAINNLSFVLNLGKTIKLRNNASSSNDNNNSSELVDYFPSLLWLLRDFHLKLEDPTGKVITEKQYLERSLQNVKGATDAVEEKNQVRTMIRTFFPERDCFTMVRPVEKETDLQNLQQLDDCQLRSEFIEQSKEFRKSVLMKIKPKMFMNKPLTGSMLVELVQSVLNAINQGNIPVIEDSWKYIIQSECIKSSNHLIEQFKSELTSFSESNQANINYIRDKNNFTKDILHKYISQFESNPLLEDDTKDSLIQKFKSKLNSELDKFNKENEVIIEKRFLGSVDELSKAFIDKFTITDKYSKNYYLFFQDIEAFISQCEELTSSFPNKAQILLDAILIIIKKYIDIYFIKNKSQSDKEIRAYKTALDKLQQKFKLNNDELNKYKQEHSTYLERLNDSIAEEKLNQKTNEDKVQVLLNEKKIEKERYERNINQIKIDFEKKYEIKFNVNNQSLNELKIKSEQINMIKAHHQKIHSINDQKILFLDQELSNMKEKCNAMVNEFKIKENALLNDIAILKAQNNNLINENKRSGKQSTDAINSNFSNLESRLNDHFYSQRKENKFILEKFMNGQQIQRDNSDEITNAYKNYKEINEENMKLIDNLTLVEDMNKKLEEQLNTMLCYKDVISNTIGFKCRSCLRVFAFDQFRLHFRKCQNFSSHTSREGISERSFSNGPDQFNNQKMKLKIIKGKVMQDELGKPFLEYVINVEYNNQSWRISKRFNQFAALYKSLKALFNNVIHLPDSANIFLNANEMYDNGPCHENKIAHLNWFITDIANIETINQSKVFRKFIEFERYNEDDFTSSFSSSRNGINLMIERDYKAINDIKEYSKDNSLFLNSRNEEKGNDYFDYDINLNH